jgi:membrane protein
MRPDKRMDWRDLWIGAAVTALLFTTGKHLIALYLARAAVGSAYGAAGSFVAIVVWVYYSAMIFLLGAEFTHVLYQNHHGLPQRS